MTWFFFDADCYDFYVFLTRNNNGEDLLPSKENITIHKNHNNLRQKKL